MKKIIVFLSIMMVALAGLALSPSSADAATRVTCWTRSTNNYMTVNMGPFYEPKTMAIVMTIKYKDCDVRGGTDFVRPIGIRVQTNVSGTHMQCGSGPYANPVTGISGYYETRWKVYFGSQYGDNFSLNRFSTACSTNTLYDTGYRAIGSRRSVPLRVDKGRSFATFRANAQADWRGSKDKTWSQFGKLYSY